MENKLNNITPRLLSLKEVIHLIGKSRSTLWRDINAGAFPSPLKIGQRRIAFRSSEISEWVNARTRVKPIIKEGK